MTTYFCLLIVILSSSCIQNKKQDSFKEKRIIEMKNNFEFDSVTVNYWESLIAVEYEIRLLEGALLVKSQNLENDLEIVNESLLNDLLNFIDIFYISNKEVIELSKNKRHERLITDFSNIQVVIFYKGGKKSEKYIQLEGDEEYQVEYNPNFLEFIDLVKKLTSEF